METKQQMDVDIQHHKTSINDNDKDVKINEADATQVENKLQAHIDNNSTIPLEKYIEKVEKLQKVSV